MKCISWNVNGIRAVLKKDFVEILYALDADIFCIQETKAQPDQIEVDCELYPYQYINSAQRKGYSGTMIFCKEEPVSVRYGMDMEEHDTEGRVITLEYPAYYVVTVYTFEEKKKDIIIEKEEDGVWNVSGPRLERVFDINKLNTEEDFYLFANKMRYLGIDTALREAGCQDGDTVRLLGFEFEFIEN